MRTSSGDPAPAPEYAECFPIFRLGRGVCGAIPDTHNVGRRVKILIQPCVLFVEVTTLEEPAGEPGLCEVRPHVQSPNGCVWPLVVVGEYRTKAVSFSILST